MRNLKFVLNVLCIAPFMADACTGMYAGKGVTVDGSVLIGRTVDFSPYNATMVQQICERGAQVSFGGHTNKYRYVCAPKSTSLHAGRYAGSAANEKGVILTGTITGVTRDKALTNDPFVPVEKGGVGEPNLPDYLIGNAATAREAVELLAGAVATNGHAGAEIYMVADTNEAWYVEVYTGHQWAARKMPQDKVAVFGNHFNLRGFDTNDTENVMFSPGLVAHAVTNNFAVWTDDSHTKLDLYLTYADRSSVETDYLNYRAWYGHKRFADKQLPAYATNLVCELFFEPGYKIAPTNMFELMRARYEDMTDEELPIPRTNAAIRVIGTTKQGNCHVLQLDCRANTPERMRGTVWSCLGQCEHGVFHPINASQDYLPAAYTNDAQRTFGYDPNRAADAFRRLSALAQSNRKWYGPGVRAYWRAREERMATEWPRLVDKAVKAQDAQKLANYTFTEETRSLAAARRLYDELMWYAAANNRIKGDGSGATDEPVDPFKPLFRARFTGSHGQTFGGAVLNVTVHEFLAAGFALGDTVDVRFDNGYVLENVPIYDGFYTRFGAPLVSCADEFVRIDRNFGGDLFDVAKLNDGGFSVEITLHEPGGLLQTQLALALAYTDERQDYASDVIFVNFRAMTGGNLLENLFYRGASPCDNRHGRASFASGLLGEVGVKCVVDLADTQDQVRGFCSDSGLQSPYWKGLATGGNVHAHPVKADFTTDVYRARTADALQTILDCSGPYYIHCLEGKDRTGFLAIVIESLAGASFDEVRADYLTTFRNYYGLDSEKDAARLDWVTEVYFGNIVCYLADCPLDEITTEKLRDGVRNYLISGGMEDEKITALVAKITGKEVR